MCRTMTVALVQAALEDRPDGGSVSGMCWALALHRREEVSQNEGQ